MKKHFYFPLSTKPAHFLLRHYSVFAIWLASSFLSVHAQITISEDFDYGNTSGNLSGQAGGTGFAAAWTGGTGAYTATGLTFGGLSGAGGAMLVSSGGNNAIRQITTGFAASGPVSGSFLFKMNAAPNSQSVLMLGLGTAGSSNNQNHYLGFMPANDGQSGLPALGIKGTSISAMTGGGALTVGTTYLYAFSYDNGSTSAWILTLAQYNNFYNGTTLDQAAMNATTIGSGATNVTGKVTLSTNPANLATMDYLYSYFFSNGSMTVDRIRMSGTAALGGLGSTTTTYTFNGTTNTDWATASNWTGGVVPTTALLASGDAVVIAANCIMTGISLTLPSGTSMTVNNGFSLNLGTGSGISIASGVTFTLNASASLIQGVITNAGTMDIYGSYTAYYMTNNSGGVMNVKSGGSYSCPACAETMNAGSTINNDGTMHLGTASSWQCTVNNNASGTITDGGNGAQIQLGSSSVVINAGSFVSRTAGTAGSFTNSGTLSTPSTCNFTIKTGATFSNSGNMTFSSSNNNLNIQASATLTNNSTGIITNNGTMAVNATGTFTNNGTYKGSGAYNTSLFTNPSGGIVAPGTSPGCQTYSNGFTNAGTLQIELGGTTACTGYDRLNVTGTATLGGTLDVSLTSGYTGNNGDLLTIINATTLSGTFATVNLPANWFINYNLPAVGQVTLSYNAPLTAAAALNFDGVDDYVVTSTSPVLTGGGFTVELWAKRSGSGTYDIAVGQGSGGVGVGNVLHVGFRNTNQFTFAFSYDDLDVNASYSDNNWHHWACVYTSAPAGSNNQFVYRDGVLVGSRTTNGAYGGSGPLTIGTVYYALTGDAFSGTIDEVRIWNTARSCEEIRQLRNCELTGSEPNLVAYYKFNQGVAEGTNTGVTTLIDATANGNNGTFNNMPRTGSTSNFVTPGGVTTGTSCPAVTFPEINLKGNGNDINYGSTTPAISNHTDFGGVLVNGSFARTFTIDNSAGTADLTISSITKSGTNQSEFVVSGITLPMTVTAGTTTTFTVTFTPTASGTRTATITVNNNDCDEVAYDFAITGNGALAGAALDFDGINDDVMIPHSSNITFDLNQDFTVSLHVKIPSSNQPNTGNIDNDIVEKVGSGGGYPYVIRYYNHTAGAGNNGKIIAARWNGSTAAIVTSTVTLNDDTWHHIAFVKSGPTLYLYVDGVLNSTTPDLTTGSTANTAPLYLGSRLGQMNWFKGGIDNLRIWNVARSCEEIRQLRNCELTGSEPNLVAYYKFNQGLAASDNSTVTSLTDATANGNNGTFNHFALNGSTSNFITPGGVTSGTSCSAVVAPEINLQGGSPLTDIADGSTTTSTTNTTDFGSVLVNGSVTKTFTISNATGSADLVISSITKSGTNQSEFVVSGITLPMTITAGTTTTFTVTFTPTASGTRTATLIVNNNDCDEAAYDFAVTGNGALAGAALDFDGVDDFVTGTSPTSFWGTTPTTIEFWSKKAPGADMFVMDLGFTYQVRFSNGKLNLSGFFLGNFQTGTDVVVDNTWTHYAITYDGNGTNSSYKAYVNGQPVSFTGSYGSHPSTNGQLRVGTANNNYFYTGAIDEVRIWKEERTAAQILANYNTEISSMSPCLDMYLKFNQGFVGANNSTITTATDAANAVVTNGTLTNFVLTGSTSNWVAGSGITEVSSAYVPAPEANLKGIDNSTIADGTTTTSTTVGTNFGSIQVSNSITHMFTFENTGNADLTVSNITSSNPQFTVSSISTSPIAGNNFATFTITFTPTATGAQNATIIVINNDCDEANYNFAVTGTGSCVAPTFSTCPTNQTANTTMGACTATVNYTATVTGTPTPTITYVFTGATTSSGNGTGSGATFNKGITTVTLTATNGCGGNATCSFTVTVNDTEAPVLACPTTQTLTASPATCTASYTIADPISDNCTGATWGYTLTGATTGAGSAIADGTGSGAISFNVGTTTVTLSGTDGTNAATGCSFTVTVNAPEINVQGNSMSIADGDATPGPDDDHTNFGSVIVGNNVVRTFTIENTGTAALTISGITSSTSKFAISNVPTSVAAMSSATFTVTFVPTAPGTQNATITINNNDCNEAVYDFAVTGSSTSNPNALHFDGADDYVPVPFNTSLMGSTPTTIEFWAKAPLQGIGFPVCINTADVAVRFHSGTHLQLEHYGGPSFDMGEVNDGCWHHYAFVWNGTTVYGYVDGQPTPNPSQTLAFPATSAGTLFIGVYNLQYFWNGAMDELRIWNVQRTQSQLQANLYNELAGNEAGLVAYYNFNEGIAGGNNTSVTTLYDNQTNTPAHNGTLTGFALTGTASNWITSGALIHYPEIDIQGNSVSIVDGDNTPSASDHTTFGDILVGANLVRTYTIKNTGSEVLNVSSIGSSNPLFTVGTLTPASPIPVGQSATFTVTFAPLAIGTETATITVNNDDCNEAVYDFAVTGNGANVGAALKFDGVDDYVDLGTSFGNFGTNDFTLETWFKTTQNSSNYVGLLSKRSPCNHDNFWNIVMVNGKIHFEIDENGANYLDLITPLAYNDGNWHHVACVRSGTSLKIYMDGSLVTSGNTSGTTNLTNATSVKMGQSPCGNFIGDLDEVRIWNTARTCEEIKQLYNCELAGNEPNLTAYYKFNQGLAVSDNSGIPNLTDSSPNGYNGTFQNMPRTGSTSNFITPGGVTTGTSCSAVVAPEINVKGNMVSIPDGNTTTSPTDHTDFGNVTVNTTLVRTFTIENTGNNPLTIASISSSNPLFTVGNLSPASPIVANGTATFTVTFVPTATGVQNATITINSNDCDEATYDFAVKATGECDATASIANTNNPICSGNNAVFNLSGTSGAIVTYNLNNTPNTVTLTGGMATVTVTGATTNQTLNLVSVNNGTCSINVTGNATVTVKPLPMVSTPLSSVCVGSTITLSPTSGGTWSSSDDTKATVTSTGVVTGIASGSVTFTFTETASGCSNTTSSVTVNPKPTSVVSGGGIVCAGETLPNVSIELTGTGPWNLTYSNGTSSTPVTGINSSPYVITGAGAGTYTVTALGDANCTGTSMTGSASVVVNPQPTLTAGTLTNPTTCGGTNGSIAFTSTNLPNGTYQLNYTGAGSPKMITVSNNAFTLSGLSAGNYSNFSITNLGCTGTFATTQSLSDPAAPTLAAGTITNPSTCGGTNGSIAFTSTNLPNGTYQLNYTGAGSPKMVTVSNNAFTLSGLSAGNYSNFSITNLGCTGTFATTQSLSDPAAPTLAAGTITNPSTCGGTNGSIAFTSTNLPNGTYQLNYTGAGSPKMVTVSNNTFTLGDLSAGNYSNFSITNLSCTGTFATTQSLSDPAAPTLAAGTITNPSTCGGTNGSIAFTSTNLPNGTYTLSYSGTGSPKMVTVSNNAFTLSGLSAGNYSNFSITNLGCTGTFATTQSLSDPAAPTLSAGTITNPSTCGGTNGSIAFTSTNLPNGTYTLSYSGTGSPKMVTVNNNAFTLNGLSAGNYSNFSVTNLGCTGTLATTQSLSDPSAPTLMAGTIINPTTCGGTNGSIAFTTTNLPNGSYTLNYSGTDSPKMVTVNNNAFTLNGLSAGNYSNFSITNLGCTGTLATTQSLSDPSAPTLTAGTLTNPTTCGGTNGSIAFSTTNLPNGNYTLNYSGTGSPKMVTVNNNTFTLNGLSAGNYSNFSITNLGCTGTFATSQSLSNPPLPTGNIIISGPTVVCQNAPFPTITFTGNGGNAPYTFTYNTNQTISTTSGNSVSISQSTAVASTFTYTLVSVKDANGCEQLQGQTATIMVHAPPVVSTPQGSLCTGLTMTLSPTSGGTWQSSNPSIATVNNVGLVQALSAGVVYFTFTQSSTGCAASTASVTIKPTPTSNLTASKVDVCANTEVTLNPNCSIPTSTVNWNPGGPTVTPAAATLPYVYRARCVADGCVGNETSVEVRTHRILVDMKDLDVGALPLPIVRPVIDNMKPTNQVNAPVFPRRWTFIANGCDASESAEFKLSGPVLFNAIDNSGTYAMFANEGNSFYSIDHSNYGNGGSFPDGTYSLTVNLRSKDGVGGPYPKNRVAVGILLATRTLQFTVVGPSHGSPQSIVGGRQSAVDGGLWTVDYGQFAEVAPNPVSNTMRLKISEAKGQNVSVSLMDASGRMMLQRSFVPETNTHQEEFNVGDITSGIYFLKVNTENKNATLKVIKVE